MGVTSEPSQEALFVNVHEVDLLRWLLADLHDDLYGKLARFQQLPDISAVLGRTFDCNPHSAEVYTLSGADRARRHSMSPLDFFGRAAQV